MVRIVRGLQRMIHGVEEVGLEIGMSHGRLSDRDPRVVRYLGKYGYIAPRCIAWRGSNLTFRVFVKLKLALTLRLFARFPAPVATVRRVHFPGKNPGKLALDGSLLKLYTVCGTFDGNPGKPGRETGTVESLYTYKGNPGTLPRLPGCEP